MRIRASKFRSVMESRGVGEAAAAAIVADYGDGWVEVDTLHPAYPRSTPSLVATGLPAAGITKELAPVSAGRPCGPGTELKAILKDWLGIEATPTCSCSSMAKKMDALGPNWCEGDQGMSEILGVMKAEHAKRWSAGKTILPWTDTGARQLVLLACRRSRSKAAG